MSECEWRVTSSRLARLDNNSSASTDDDRSSPALQQQEGKNKKFRFPDFDLLMGDMLTRLGLELEGHHHLGIDDARNIAKIACELQRRFGSPPPPETTEAVETEAERAPAPTAHQHPHKPPVSSLVLYSPPNSCYELF